MRGEVHYKALESAKRLQKFNNPNENGRLTGDGGRRSFRQDGAGHEKENEANNGGSKH